MWKNVAYPILALLEYSEMIMTMRCFTFKPQEEKYIAIIKYLNRSSLVIWFVAEQVCISKYIDFKCTISFYTIYHTVVYRTI